MLKTYAQLLRLPNVFTAWSDMLLAWFWARFHWASVDSILAADMGVLLLLLLASGTLYCSGMAWNDFFDVEQDLRERPNRPIPSGRVKRSTAGLVAGGLMVLGLGATVSLGWWTSLTAGMLAGCILLYDGWAKKFWAGPIAMGTCRFLHILLGFAPFDGGWSMSAWLLAGMIGLYIVGVTWFARKESAISRRGELSAAFAVVLVAVLGAAALPLVWDRTMEVHTFSYWILLLAWLVVVARPARHAILSPQPAQVQSAIKTFILGLIGLDAVLAFLLIGLPGLLLLVLLVPALTLGRWVYST